MKLSDMAISAIIEEIEDRTKEAEAEYQKDKENEFKQGYYEAYFEVMEIIKNRQNW